MKRDKVVCVVREEGTDSLRFDCDADCACCPFENRDECSEYEFSDKEKIVALKKYIARMEG